MSRFADQNVVVTGVSGALGHAVARAFLDEGARVFAPTLEDPWSPPDELGSDRLHVVTGVDLTDRAAARAFFDGLDGALHASVHCAGGFAMAPFAELDDDDLARLFALNVHTATWCCQGALGRMGEGGRIVNVSARPALRPEQGGGMVAYTMSKAAVDALGKALDAEVRDRGVRVCAVAPSILDTPANRSAMPDADFDAWPKPADVAAAILFLASQDNALTGAETLPVYGRV